MFDMGQRGIVLTGQSTPSSNIDFTDISQGLFKTREMRSIGQWIHKRNPLCKVVVGFV